jgi:tetratricopeptide (TPR) repeat protein
MSPSGKICLILIMTLSALFASRPLHSGERVAGNDLLLGGRAGYSWISGSYGREMSGGGEYGLFLIYSMPSVFRYFAVEADLSYSTHRLLSDPGSKIHSLSFSAGPDLWFPLHRYFKPFVGIAILGDYLRLKADLYGRNISAFKPGGIVRAGFFFNLLAGLESMVGFEYSIVPLSGRPFMNTKITCGVSYNFSVSYDNSGKDGIRLEDRQERLERIYRSGVDSFERGDFDSAGEYFKALASLERKYRDSAAYIGRIEFAEKNHAEAARLYGEKKYFEALQCLERSPDRPVKSVELQNKLRMELAGEISGLEKQGIAAYDSKDFRRCIIIMKKILTIDPANKTAGLYLPRAFKRHEALKKLQGE